MSKGKSIPIEEVFPKGTVVLSSEYNEVRERVDAWGELMDTLDQRIMKIVADEGIIAERQLNSGTIKQLEQFMLKYGYRNGSGWWVKI